MSYKLFLNIKYYLNIIKQDYRSTIKPKIFDEKMAEIKDIKSDIKQLMIVYMEIFNQIKIAYKSRSHKTFIISNQEIIKHTKTIELNNKKILNISSLLSVVLYNTLPFSEQYPKKSICLVNKHINYDINTSIYNLIELISKNKQKYLINRLLNCDFKTFKLGENKLNISLYHLAKNKNEVSAPIGYLTLKASKNRHSFNINYFFIFEYYKIGGYDTLLMDFIIDICRNNNIILTITKETGTNQLNIVYLT